MYSGLNGYDMEKIGRPLAEPITRLAKAQEHANRIRAAELLLEHDEPHDTNALRVLQNAVRP